MFIAKKYEKEEIKEIITKWIKDWNYNGKVGWSFFYDKKGNPYFASFSYGRNKENKYELHILVGKAFDYTVDRKEEMIEDICNFIDKIMEE